MTTHDQGKMETSKRGRLRLAANGLRLDGSFVIREARCAA